MNASQSVKQLENAESTGNQTNIHMWTPSRSQKKKPTKDSLVAELSALGLKKLELRAMSIDGLVALIDTIKLGSSISEVPESAKKAPYLETLAQFSIPTIEKCSLPTLKGLCEFLHE